MRLIIGLGNIDKKFHLTKHNLGFLMIDVIANKLGVDLKENKFDCLYFENGNYALLKPQLNMNNSGKSLINFIKEFNVSIEELIVIYDDISLPLGDFRYRLKGSYGGHKGIKDIIMNLKTNNFKRLKMGIGFNKDKFSIKDWVLSEFSILEINKIKMIFENNLLDDIVEWIKGKDFEKIINKKIKKDES